MDLNLVVLLGRLSAPPDIVTNANTTVRLLVAVRSEWPVKRLDLVPVIWWNPSHDEVSGLPQVGARVWATGSVQRRYWEGPDGRRSRIEMIAEHVSFPSDNELAAQCSQGLGAP